MYRVVVFFFITVLLPLCVVEGVLRWRSTEPSVESLYVLDETLGWKLRADAQFLFTEEGHGLVQINSEGFRSFEFDITKPLNTIRIALLGDSFFEAKQVDFADSFPVLLQQQLEDCLVDKKVEVLNFAAQGYGTVQQYLLFEDYASKYSPDLVLLGFYEGNDVFDNHPLLNPGNAELAPYVESRSLKRGRNLEFITNKKSLVFKMRFWLKEFGKYSFIARRLSSFIADMTKPEKLLSVEEYEWTLLRAPLKDELVEAWKITEVVIKELRRKVQLYGSEFKLLSIPVAIAVHPDSEQRKAFMSNYGLRDFKYPATRIKALLLDSEFLELQPQFNSVVKSEKRAVHGFLNSRPGYGHWNKLGHQAVANYVVGQLCPELSRDSRLDPY